MRRRLYFLFPDIEVVRKVVDELLLARIEESHMHLLARDGVPRKRVDEITGLVKSHHPEADIMGVEPTIPAFP